MRAVFATLTVLSLSFLPLATAAHADALENLTKAETKMYEAWAKVPFSERIVTFVAQKSGGYGIYQEKQGTVFKQGEPVITYVEPIGFGWKELPGEMYETNFVADLVLKDDKGAVVTDQKGFVKNVLQSHNAITEFSMDFTLTLDGAPAGNYVVTYTINDISSGEKFSFDQDFSIAAQ
ncbi:hypothetical protein [Neorhizobium sp. JUb45]|uniref:hypothetical protein n=1 Tax=unclassified Neorhizobium TaxID=2629175 RepID=UPI001047A74E|nr:hypothetical protein [Neorhizobium sp. JUb45]TCR06770.1 hypothetical protein EDF70_101731 [Neorhizobium sp. JUb45]